MINVAIFGAAGRMGSTVARLIISAADLMLVAAFEKLGHPALGKAVSAFTGLDSTLSDEASLKIRPTPLIKEGLLTIMPGRDMADVAIDFTAPQAAVEHAGLCAKEKLPLVSGTTGLSPEQEAQIAEWAYRIPIVRSANFSIGANVLFKLTEEASCILSKDYDVVIVEAHHRLKKDAPSGTARRLAQAAAASRKQKPEEILANVHAIRAGAIVGEHTVLFVGENEKIAISHQAFSRDVFAEGALQASRWIVAQEKVGLYGIVPPKTGLYDMFDVLGLRSDK